MCYISFYIPAPSRPALAHTQIYIHNSQNTASEGLLRTGNCLSVLHSLHEKQVAITQQQMQSSDANLSAHRFHISLSASMVTSRAPPRREMVLSVISRTRRQSGRHRRPPHPRHARYRAHIYYIVCVRVCVCACVCATCQHRQRRFPPSAKRGE